MGETKGCRVLVVSDFSCHEFFVQRMLARGGRSSDQVKLAPGAREGLALAEQDPPDLIIAYLWMLDMDGYEFCRQIKTNQALQNVPILLQSNVYPGIVYTEAQRAGAAGYLYHAPDLVTACDAVLNGQTYYPPGPYKHTQWDKVTDEKGRRVLVIDDSPEMADLMELILGRRRNDEVRYAEGGRKGLAAAEQNPPDLIILDIMMPDLNGYEVYQRLRTMPALQNVPILFQAAIDPKRVYPEAQRLGAAGYICEPYGPQELIAARDAALRGETFYPPLQERP